MAEQIHGEIFAQLCDTVLRNDLKISSERHRIRLISKVQKRRTYSSSTGWREYLQWAQKHHVTVIILCVYNYQVMWMHFSLSYEKLWKKMCEHLGPPSPQLSIPWKKKWKSLVTQIIHSSTNDPVHTTRQRVSYILDFCSGLDRLFNGGDGPHIIANPCMTIYGSKVFPFYCFIRGAWQYVPTEKFDWVD